MAQVLDDVDSAPVDARVGATLRVLARLTVDPENFGAAQLAEARAAGVSDSALADAIGVCALFNVATRCADALAFDVTSANPHALAQFGYRPPPSARPTVEPERS
ncbi:MAG: hypothetical protein M3326_00080 [Actinomycetota bacterium]|nr:hypothetical protein [Actinomycetota bacterium]